MPNAVVARLLTGALTAAAVLAPAWVATPASAVSASGSCAAVRLADPTAPDGEYEITAFDQTVTVWCADMAATPIEYLTLPRTGGGFNFSQDTFSVRVTTHYTRVRLNLPSGAGGAFSVNPTDDRFATTDLGAGNRRWGSTGSCFNISGNNANLDLTGTPFGMSTDNFAYTGFGSLSASSPQVIDIVDAGGWCGDILATDPFPLSWRYSAPMVTADPASQTAASGTDVTFGGEGFGVPTPTVTWQSSPDGVTWTDVPGVTGDELTLVGVTTVLDGTSYRALVTNSQGTAPTDAAVLTVTPLASTVSDPAGTRVVSGSDAAFSVTVTGDPVPTIQWQRSTDGSAWSDIDGATTGDLVLAGVTTADDGLLVRAVSTNVAGADTSEPAALAVDPSVPAVSDPAGSSVTSGDDAAFSVTTTGDPAPSLQWQTSADGAAWADVGGATGTELVLVGVTTAQDDHLYRAIATNAGGSATSAPAMLSVAPAPPVLTAAPVAQRVDTGGDGVFTAGATGDPAPTYLWQTSADNVVWTDVVGARTGTLTLAAVTAADDGLWIRVYVANEGGAVTSDGVQLTVVPAATPTPDGRAAALALTGGDPFATLRLAGMLLVAGTCGTVLGRRLRNVARS